jgi:hypothetical protein
MKHFLIGLVCGLCFSAFYFHAEASTVISGTLSITNYSALTNATSGQYFSLNGDVRTFTNSLASAASQIRVLTNDSASTILLRIAGQVGSYPFANVPSVTVSAGTNITFRATNDTALTITLSPTNWGRVTYATQTVGTVQTVVRVPISAEDSGARAGIVEQLLSAFNDYSTSRGFTNWTLNAPAFTNLGRAEFGGRVELDAGLGLHGRGLVSTNYTLGTNDLYVGVDTRSNTNLIMTLPSADSASNLLFVLKDEGGAGATNTLKIYPASGDRIDTLLTNLVVSNNFGGVMLRSRGLTNWAVIASGGGVSGDAPSGEVNTASNLGTSNATVKPMFAGKSGVDFTFRQIEAGTNVSLGITSTSIVVNASSGGGTLTGNSVWIDKVNGNDGTGARGSLSTPFLTLAAAVAAAASGDTIFVLPGNWNESQIAKDGVNWHFFNGASISNSSGNYIWEALTTNTFNVTGEGVFDGYVLSASSGSSVSIKCKRITSLANPILMNYGTLNLEADTVDCTFDTVIYGGGNITVNRSAVRTAAGGAPPAIRLTVADGSLTLKDCVLTSDGTYSISAATNPTNVRIYGRLMANKTQQNITFITGGSHFEVDTDVQ